jgi:hypothetical protein
LREARASSTTRVRERGGRRGGNGEELLLRAVDAGDEVGGGLCLGERPWRLNFDRFRRPEAGQQDKPTRGLHDCLSVIGLPCLSDERSR